MQTKLFKSSGRIIDYAYANNVKSKSGFNKFADMISTEKRKFDDDLSKVAEEDIKKEEAKEEPGIKIVEDEFDPEFLYVRVRACSANIPNNNGDLFTVEELKRTYKTFIGQRVFKNHKSDDVSNSRGQIMDAIWCDNAKDEDHPWVECLLKVDRKKDPNLVRGIEKGYISDVSMGAVAVGTLITLADYSVKKIEDIDIKNDLIITHTGEVASIKNMQITPCNEDIYKLKILGIEDELGITHEHPVYVIKKDDFEINDYNMQFVFTENLEIGDYTLSLLSQDNVNLFKCLEGQFIYKNYLVSPIVDIRKEHFDGYGYNIESNINESFVANGIAVHNCRVQYSVCSCCGNKAYTEDDYCECVKSYKGRDICPAHKGKKQNMSVHEENYGVEFFELSFVTDGADKEAVVKEIVASDAFSKELPERLKIVASALVNTENIMFQEFGIYLRKLAHQDVIADDDMEKANAILNTIKKFC